MKITVLIENTAEEPLKGEHGLSLLIKDKEENVLLDAGTTDLFMENAKLLGVDIRTVKAAVLSHGHYDHSGGFERYLEENTKTPLYMMKAADGEYYSGKGELHEIGIPKNVIEKHKNQFVFIEGITQIGEHIYLIPHSTEGLEIIGERAKLYKKVAGELLPDDFAHELSLVCDTEKGLVICNSCSHGGVKNILSEVQNAFSEKNMYAFIGGLHMKGGEFSNEEIKELVTYMKNVGIQHLYTGHCTGEEAFSVLKSAGGDMVQDLKTGKVIAIMETLKEGA